MLSLALGNDQALRIATADLAQLSSNIDAEHCAVFLFHMSSPATIGITASLFHRSRSSPYYQSRRCQECARDIKPIVFIGRVKTVWLRRVGRGRRLPRLEPTTADYDRTFSVRPTTSDPIQPDATGHAHQADSWVEWNRIGRCLLGLR